MYRKETYRKVFRIVCDTRGSSKAVSLVRPQDNRMGDRVKVAKGPFLYGGRKEARGVGDRYRILPSSLGGSLGYRV